MNKLSGFLEKTLQPITTWVAKNKYLSTISQVFISLIPVIVVGAFALIFSKSPVNYTGFEEGSFWYNFFLSWNDWTKANLETLKFVNSATLGSLSLWVSVGIAYRWARKYDLDIVLTMVVVVVNFLLINSSRIDGGWSTAYFGGEGLFTAIISAFVIVQLYKTLIHKGIGKINLPPSVPGALTKSLSSMLPMVICFLTGCIVTMASNRFFSASVPQLLMSVVKPLNTGVDNPVVPSLIYMVSDIGYWFGIHTSAVSAPFSPMMYANLASNAAAFAEGVPASDLPYIINVAFRYSFAGIGGSGATFGLVLLLLKSKAESLRSIGKLSIIPACFGINEPVVFGLPIMMNITFFIPFILIEAINGIIAYFIMKFNLLNKPIFFMGGTAPEIFRSVLSNMDLRSIIFWVAVVAIDVVLWYPFFKVYEKQKLTEEEAMIQSEQN